MVDKREVSFFSFAVQPISTCIHSLTYSYFMVCIVALIFYISMASIGFLCYGMIFLCYNMLMLCYALLYLEKK